MADRMDRISTEIQSRANASPWDLTALKLRSLFSGYPGFIKHYAATLSTRRLAMLSVAIDRHRIRHGNLAATFDAIDSEFLPAEVGDPNSGDAAHHKIEPDDGYALWFNGWDGNDDGGVAGKRTDEGDVVWRIRRFAPAK